MNVLTKQRHLLAIAPSDPGSVTFSPHDEGVFEVAPALVMKHSDWVDMGSPQELTITVEPGDLLNG